MSKRARHRVSPGPANPVGRASWASLGLRKEYPVVSSAETRARLETSRESPKAPLGVSKRRVGPHRLWIFNRAGEPQASETSAGLLGRGTQGLRFPSKAESRLAGPAASWAPSMETVPLPMGSLSCAASKLPWLPGSR